MPNKPRDLAEIGQSPDWDGVVAEVVQKIQLLRAAFEAFPTADTRAMFMRDLGLPALSHLAVFCASVRIEPEDD